jgi:hypothetical protein
MNDEPLDSTTVPRIMNARITDLPRQLGDPLPEVWITLSDRTEKLLFKYYSDEISFTEQELVGLTEEEARLLKFARDRAYLQS